MPALLKITFIAVIIHGTMPHVTMDITIRELVMEVVKIIAATALPMSIVLVTTPGILAAKENIQFTSILLLMVARRILTTRDST
jgi:hypothetical protein